MLAVRRFPNSYPTYPVSCVVRVTFKTSAICSLIDFNTSQYRLRSDNTHVCNTLSDIYAVSGDGKIQGSESYEVQVMTESDSKNRRRSQRVMLQLAVLVRANMPDGRCVQIQAFTLVVNAHGGLLESPLELTANQRITVINPHSRKDVACRVVRIERSSSALLQVAFEFDQRSAHFWPISFPPEDWGVVKEVANDNC